MAFRQETSGIPKRLIFHNGVQMPVVGLGLWKGGTDCDVETAVDRALEIGYRHFDTAYLYETEVSLGKSIKKWIEAGKGKREDLFITTKLPMHGMAPERVAHFLKQSLLDLNLSYVDLYLIHWPVAVKYFSDKEFLPRNEKGELIIDTSTDLEEIWRALEAQVDAGLTISIGMSNFNETQIKRILKIARIRPSVVQAEMHLCCQQKSLRKFCKEHSLALCAYSPLGAPWRKSYSRSSNNLPDSVNILTNETVVKIARKYDRSPAQILLRFLLELGEVAVIPKSSNAERLLQNFDLFSFKLGLQDVRKLEAFDRGNAGRTSFAKPEQDIHPENPFPRNLIKPEVLMG